MPPRRSATSATAARTAASSVTSALTPTKGSPGGLTSRQATRAPRSASMVAVARPIPEPPPVTSAASPPNSLIWLLQLFLRLFLLPHADSSAPVSATFQTGPSGNV